MLLAWMTLSFGGTNRLCLISLPSFTHLTSGFCSRDCVLFVPILFTHAPSGPISEYRTAHLFSYALGLGSPFLGLTKCVNFQSHNFPLRILSRFFIGSLLSIPSLFKSLMPLQPNLEIQG
ncbi:hypothetical protein B0J11DRAFT_321393 [Dendryphion nanum]|uniref:Uncharacterized protein n=1 Tax=Dendryphion nanum TaxID=256645 RepID=A0A9P9ILK9_9PLEO|nr:hypothetical protein B0J11DRAFT_321393 [Dendryphion nanum]